MAKRYGRNQRRKHREEIAATQADLEKTTARYRGVLSELWHLEEVIKDWDCDVRELLGAYSAFLIEMPTVRGRVEPFRIDNPKPCDPFPTFEVLSPTMSAVRVINTLRHEISVRNNPHTPYLEQIVRLSHDDGNGPTIHTCYSIDGKTLMRLGKRDIPALAQKIAYEMAAHWNGAL